MTHTFNSPARSDERVGAGISRKVLVRLVLPLAVFFLVSSLDRANVAFASLQMNRAIGLSSAEYGFGAGVLFVGYLASKYPSVLLFERVGLRRWLSLIALCWGAAATTMAFIQNEWTFYALRFVIGVAEGGLSSGLMLYLSHWATPRYRASILALPIAAIPVSQIIGAPLSGYLIEAANPLNWEGWRWMFFIEGLPALLLAGLAFVYFPDRPKEARWLSLEEKQWLEQNVVGSTPPHRISAGERWTALSSPVTWLCAGIWFCSLAGNYGVMFWLPQVVKSMADLTPTQVGFIVALPWTANALGNLVNARHSDKTQERYLHLAVPFACAGLALVSAYLAGGGLGGLAALIVAGFCLGAVVAPLWAIPATLLTPASMAVGIVTINMFGSLAGLSVPTAMGVVRDATNSFAAPTFFLASILMLGACLALFARRFQRSGPSAAT